MITWYIFHFNGFNPKSLFMITQVRFTENQLHRKPKLFDAYVSLCNISVVILNKKFEKISSSHTAWTQRQAIGSFKVRSDVQILLQITQHKTHQGKSITLVWMWNLQQLEIFLIDANYATHYLRWLAMHN